MDAIQRTDVNALLVQMREMRAAAQGKLQAEIAFDGAANVQPNQRDDFHQMFKAALTSVNEAQQASGRLTEQFVRGETKDLVEVMVQMQKANVSMQALTQVRNRMVTAYQEIMNMPI